jgi:hypothetical protein
MAPDASWHTARAGRPAKAKEVEDKVSQQWERTCAAVWQAQRYTRPRNLRATHLVPHVVDHALDQGAVSTGKPLDLGERHRVQRALSLGAALPKGQQQDAAGPE